jgi:hypothetical protein
MIYDIFYVSKSVINDTEWKQFRNRFPSAQKVENVKTLDDIKKKSFTKFYWVVWDDLVVSDNFSFDYRVPVWDESYIHVWKNDQVYDGICLFSKNISITQKEFDYRFFTNKKEIDVIASMPTPFDIFFISYDEVNADKNYEKLISRFPTVKRIHGIKGIHNAHLEAAKQSSSEFFWVVDADAEIVEDFNFHYQIPFYDNHAKSCVYVWFSKNPVNGLEYGYGGVKLLPKLLTENMNINSVDMTTSISKNLKVIKQISNITNFNVDEFSTWRSAFRECVKLASKVIDSKYAIETDERLETWITKGADQLHGNFAIAGAKAGKTFGYQWMGNKKMLSKINDFDWLKEEFEKCLTTMSTE